MDGVITISSLFRRYRVPTRSPRKTSVISGIWYSPLSMHGECYIAARHFCLTTATAPDSKDSLRVGLSVQALEWRKFRPTS